MGVKISAAQTIMIFCLDLANGFSSSSLIPETEYQFAKPRKFAFDFGWPVFKLALEIEGGVYGSGKPCPVCKRPAPRGHSSFTGIMRDMEKYNLAARLGWRVIRFTPKQIEEGEAFPLLEEMLR